MDYHIDCCQRHYWPDAVMNALLHWTMIRQPYYLSIPLADFVGIGAQSAMPTHLKHHSTIGSASRQSDNWVEWSY
jgi:hypothetical protein